MIDSNRGLGKYIVLTIITCGIYSWYFLYKLAADVNTMCKEDGEKTAGLVTLILLSIITCGIYTLVWYYKLGNRLMANAPKYGLMFTENGTSVLMWITFGSLLCGIGFFIALNILIKNTNAMANAYNAKVRV
jgi:small-conductance mechanosensitive channel